MDQPIRGHGGHLDFLIGPKTTNLVEDTEFLRHQILFSGVDEVENVSANGRPRQPIFVFLSAPKNKLVKDIEILFSFVSSRNSVRQFQRRRLCLSQSEVRAAILFFRSVRKKKHSLGRRPFFLSNFVKFCSAVLEKSKM